MNDVESSDPLPRSRLALVSLLVVVIPLVLMVVLPGFIYPAIVGVPLGFLLGLAALVWKALDSRRSGTGFAVAAVGLSGAVMGFAFWFLSGWKGGFHGRVLRVRGRPVLAPVGTLRERPAGDAPLFECAGLADPDRAVIAEHWTLVAREEYTSIAAFERLAGALEARGVPRSLVEGAAAAALQEADHAARCFALASAFAGRVRVPGALVVGDASTPTLVTLAVEALVDGCVGEGTGASEAALLAAEGPTIDRLRSTFTVIADDEAEHAELSWAVLAWCLSVGGEDVRAAVERALAGLSDDAASMTGTAKSPAQRAHGMATRAERADAWRTTLAATRARLGGLLAAPTERNCTPSKGAPLTSVVPSPDRSTLR